MSAHQADKKKLLKRLKGFCAAFGDNLSSIEPSLLARIEGGIKQLSTPKKVAIAGLKDSGHYDLTAFLLGVDLMSEGATRDACPIIHVRHGAADQTHAVFGEKVRSLKGHAIDSLITGKKPDRIELELTVPIVADIAFSVMPAYDAEEDRANYIFELLNDVDVLIWCSNATEQWHSRERRLWFTVPDELKSRSVLALTNADHVEDGAMRATFDEKCNLVMDEFRTLCPISVEAAKQAAPGGNLIDPEGFADSGGQEILGTLMALLSESDKALIEEIRALRVEMDAIPLGGHEAAPAPENLAPLKAAASTEEAPKPTSEEPAAEANDSVKAFLEEHATACITAAENSDATDFADLFEAMETLLSRLKAFLKDGLDVSDKDIIATQLEDASDLVGLLRYENNANAAKDGADIIRQVSVDFWNCLNAVNEQGEQTDTSMKKAS